MGKVNDMYNHFFADSATPEAEDGDWAEWADGSPQSLAFMKTELTPEQRSALCGLGFAGLTQAGMEIELGIMPTTNDKEA